jgi:hypothetical protein
MNQNYNNFVKWFKEPLDCLYTNNDAGFVILMISLPLLERYLREKSGVHEGNLTDDFYNKFIEIFPSLKDKDIAKKFWQIYRNGLLHQATLSLKTKKGTIKLLAVGVHGDASEVEYEGYSAQGDKFKVSPRKFSEKVIATIQSDFTTFEGVSSADHPPAKVSPTTGISGWDSSKK